MLPRQPLVSGFRLKLDNVLRFRHERHTACNRQETWHFLERETNRFGAIATKFRLAREKVCRGTNCVVDVVDLKRNERK